MLKHVLSYNGFNMGDNIGTSAGPPVTCMRRWSTLMSDTCYIAVFDNTRMMPGLIDETYEPQIPDFERLKS